MMITLGQTQPSELLARPGITIAVIAVVGVILLYGCIRFWLVATRPTAIKDVSTPTLDRLNTQALQQMSNEPQEEVDQDRPERENEAAPADLLDVVPPEDPEKDARI